MPKKLSTPLASVEKIAAREAAAMGYELIELELVTEPTGRFLRFYVDKPGGISLDDLEAYHRRIQPETDALDYDYMEVSSPGADRPLKTPADFARAEGEWISVKLYRAVNGQKVMEGRLIGLRDDQIVIEQAEGERAFAWKDVAIARPVVTYDEIE